MTPFTFKQLCAFVHGGLTEMFKPDSIGVEKFSKYHIHFFTRCFSLHLGKLSSEDNNLMVVFRHTIVGVIKYKPIQEETAKEIIVYAKKLKDELS